MLGTCLLRLLVLMDCMVNAMIGGSINETMSACADRMRERGQPVWGWTANFIDTLFFWQDGHCHAARLAEAKNGGALYWMPRWLMVEI